MQTCFVWSCIRLCGVPRPLSSRKTCQKRWIVFVFNWEMINLFSLNSAFVWFKTHHTMVKCAPDFQNGGNHPLSRAALTNWRNIVKCQEPVRVDALTEFKILKNMSKRWTRWCVLERFFSLFFPQCVCPCMCAGWRGGDVLWDFRRTRHTAVQRNNYDFD